MTSVFTGFFHHSLVTSTLTHLNLYNILGKKAWLQKLDFLQKKR